jgi:carbamoyl-phosphate synthase large subunit
MLRKAQIPLREDLRKILVLGSGAIKIGEAGEFDYSGSQALKALREEGIETVLVNPNIATIQTDDKFSDRVYLLPINADFVEKIIERERPDGILLGFGGQTALNCGAELATRGILDEYDVKVLGTSIQGIRKTEDRALFRKTMEDADVRVCKSKAASSLEEAFNIAKKIGYPVIVRPGYTLGGLGSGIARNEDELKKIVRRGLAQSRISQVLIEECVIGWREIEYEVVRDYSDNCLIVCDMENFDPMGVHTGDSIVVAPAQTLSRSESKKLREIAARVVRAVDVVGECNIQFALNKDGNYRVIEVNSRLSRSSALASKATGYPLAYIAAKLAIGYDLPNLQRKIPRAFAEPSLDYMVVKIPRWDLQKFRRVDEKIGTQMKSVGEVMGIGKRFEEAVQKAVRMLDIGKSGLETDSKLEKEKLAEILKNPTDKRLFHIYLAFRKGISLRKIHELTQISPFFLKGIKNIVEFEKTLTERSLSREILLKAKKLGFSDEQIARIKAKEEGEIRELRKSFGIVPKVKRVNALVEKSLSANYLYLTYNCDEEDSFYSKSEKIVVLGSGPYRIGSSVEFDWSAVNTVLTLRKQGYEAIMINCNPETVSTDYDVSDKLYFEELTCERVLDIHEKEEPLGAIVSVGGQIPNDLALSLHNFGVTILGTSPRQIDKAEDRAKFSGFLDELRINQPKWNRFTNLEDAKEFSRKIGYPVLIRPSYVLSGSAMRVANDEDELEDYLQLAVKISKKHPVVISKFIRNAKEVEVDGVSDSQNVLIGAVIEHIENAGVHSGDATMVVPPVTIPQDMVGMIRENSAKIAKALQIRGPFNIQYILKDNELFVIECNLRASRSIPFVSKIKNVNLIENATEVMLGKPLETTEITKITHFGVKVPQFSFMRLDGADPTLGVEMVSTGEVACLGEDFYEAFLKSLISSQLEIPLENSSVLISICDELKPRILETAKKLDQLGFKIYATPGTSKFLTRNGIQTEVLYKVFESKKPNILDYLINRKIDMVLTIPPVENDGTAKEDNYLIRRTSIESNIPVIMNIELAKALTNAIEQKRGRVLQIKSWNEYFT